jgi:hypothetical protein
MTPLYLYLLKLLELPWFYRHSNPMLSSIVKSSQTKAGADTLGKEEESNGQDTTDARRKTTNVVITN